MSPEERKARDEAYALVAAEVTVPVKHIAMISLHAAKEFGICPSKVYLSEIDQPPVVGEIPVHNAVIVITGPMTIEDLRRIDAWFNGFVQDIAQGLDRTKVIHTNGLGNGGES